MYDIFLWNWNICGLNDDGIFIASYINSTIVDKIWSTIEEQGRLVNFVDSPIPRLQ
jgi:hypothetical protein